MISGNSPGYKGQKGNGQKADRYGRVISKEETPACGLCDHCSHKRYPCCIRQPKSCQEIDPSFGTQHSQNLLSGHSYRFQQRQLLFPADHRHRRSIEKVQYADHKQHPAQKTQDQHIFSGKLAALLLQFHAGVHEKLRLISQIVFQPFSQCFLLSFLCLDPHSHRPRISSHLKISLFRKVKRNIIISTCSKRILQIIRHSPHPQNLELSLLSFDLKGDPVPRF